MLSFELSGTLDFTREDVQSDSIGFSVGFGSRNLHNITDKDWTLALPILLLHKRQERRSMARLVNAATTSSVGFYFSSGSFEHWVGARF